ncbi:MAG TPA: universal stress protein [Steroidobacteraceae bacterium]|nr:universal stress protein [Steroidobacteraceae bacterium]
MKKLRRILVTVADLAQEQRGVLRRAASLARASGARIELFHAVTEPHFYSRGSGNGILDLQITPGESLRAAQECLARIARSRLLTGCRVEAVAVWEKPAHEAIIRHALATRADLILSGTRSRGLASRLLLRHTDWELLRHAPMPVWLVKSERTASKAVVLAAIDPLHANAKPTQLDPLILDAAQGMASLLKGVTHAFHAFMPLSITLAAGVGEPMAWDSRELDADYAQRVSREFSRILRGTAIPTTRWHLRAGPIVPELTACTNRVRATLLVMGAGSRARLDRLFIGNTAERILDDVACDVLVVKPRGFKTPIKAKKT